MRKGVSLTALFENMNYKRTVCNWAFCVLHVYVIHLIFLILKLDEKIISSKTFIFNLMYC